jgi:hypothetical protein
MFSEGAVYGAIVVVAVAVLGTLALFRWGLQRRWFHWLAVGGTSVLSLGTFVVLMAASHVVRIASDHAVEKGRVIGTATMRSGDHDVEIAAHGSGVTLIVNESVRPLEVRTLVYGELAPRTLVPPDVAVDAHSAYTLHANLDYIGPDHAPPSSVSTQGGGKVQYWLTW